MSDSDIPQWKKDLIARLRSQNKRTAMVPVPSSSVQEAVSSSRATEKCECATKMVQERPWNGLSEDEEDLHYGPGIVSKLKERYLSLAQREKPRPSILRKAASLEDMLDEAQDSGNRLFQTNQNADTKTTHNRYRNMKRGSELKRARSVETISNTEVKEENKPKRESMHEEMLIKGSELIMEKPEITTYTQRVNRPKRVQPVMNEKEKPPIDVVKQAKMIFERKPEQRTKQPQQTGEVAAKVATYKNIIVQNKKKPAIKTKPNITNGIRVKTKDNRSPEVTSPKSPIKNKFGFSSPPVSPRKKIDLEKKNLDLENEKSTNSLPSPIPDISRVDFKDDDNVNKTTSLTETPDLIITSSPLPVVNSPSFRISATEHFIKEEIRLASADRTPPSPTKPPSDEAKQPPPTTIDTSTSMTFNFAKGAAPNATKTQNHLPVNKNVLNTQTPPSQPLKLEINGVHETKKPTKPTTNDVVKAGQILVSAKPNLTNLEIEKNFINAAKTLEQQPPTPPLSKNSISSGGSVVTKRVEEVTVKVPKEKKSTREIENNTIVFNFTARKDVPDYVHNDGVNRVSKLEKPKVGEGGIILLPGASIGESFTDEDDEILRSLEGPPSPCDVTFINDNILIDGKSSLSQKTKKAKLKISFVDEGPKIFEYPSESSLLIEDSPSPPVPQMRNKVPITGSSSLANYTPKTSTEDFLPGVTRSIVNTTPTPKQETVDTDGLLLHEVDKPILFSAGANSDILF